MKTLNDEGNSRNKPIFNLFNGILHFLEHNRIGYRKDMKGRKIDNVTFNLPNVTGYIGSRKKKKKARLIDIDRSPLPLWLPVDLKAWNESLRRSFPKWNFD